MNRVAQLVGASIGLVGIYLIATVLPLLFEAVKILEWVLLALFVLWLIVGAMLVTTGYRAIFRQTASDIKSMSFIAAFIVFVFTDNIFKPIVMRAVSFENPRQIEHLSSVLSIVSAILVYQVLKRTTGKKGVT